MNYSVGSNGMMNFFLISV